MANSKPSGIFQLKIPGNQITAIIGPSGCGKSTLLRSINRMNDLVPNVRMDGQIILHGENIISPGVDVVDVRRRSRDGLPTTQSFSRRVSMITLPMGHVCMGSVIVYGLDEIVFNALRAGCAVG